LTTNEWLIAEQLSERYWLYVVWDPITPDAQPILVQNPALRLENAAREVRAISHVELAAEAIENVKLIEG
jgi:hypothetical protein